MPLKENTKKYSLKTKATLANNDVLVGNIVKRTDLLMNIIQKTIISIQRYKSIDVLGSIELKSGLESLHRGFVNLDKVRSKIDSDHSPDELLDDLQKASNDISSIFRSYGTESMKDLLMVCFGSDYYDIIMKNMDDHDKNKLKMIIDYSHPISYKIHQWKKDPIEKYLRRNRVVDDIMIVESGKTLDCFDMARTSKNFHTKVYGIKIAFRNESLRKTLIVCALIDDIMLECAGSIFVNNKILSIKSSADSKENETELHRYLKSLTLKDLFVYNEDELINKYVGYQNQNMLNKQKTISQVTKEFLGNELFQQRTILLQLLLKANEHEYQYLAYLLYDLLTNDAKGKVDTVDQTMIFDSLPWNVKKYFRDALKATVNYTHTLSSFDNSKIPLEQQICLMKADDSVKEKAMLKLKEVKAKSEDSGSKARQYLEGLLRIPFGIYRNEGILNVMGDSVTAFNKLISKIRENNTKITEFPVKDSYSSLEVRNYSNIISEKYLLKIKSQFAEKVKRLITNNKRNMLITNICKINTFIKKEDISYPKLFHSGKKINYMRNAISKLIDFYKYDSNMISKVAKSCNIIENNENIVSLISESLGNINSKTQEISDFMSSVRETLDSAVHGHEKAKRQVERIIGQWVNGEKTGYCFGFEGPPGVGKTSLAKKGIANCLKDEDGVSRPFAFIAIGGSSNGSTLDGHNYTYVGSTWGRITDILIETKCMNPIIFIDELDKISRTEHGKEIIGILTHLIDSTQNDTFQDKYFNGIDLDLSKALFIFSYNDADLLDRILLDRIHRVKFKHLSLEEKLVITRNHLFPEIFKKMGLLDVIDISDEVVKYVIEQYTCEPGVRKLKELLFEIIGEINLTVLQQTKKYELPITVTQEDIKYKYLKERHEMRVKYTHNKANVGLISGLWANAMGQGGVLPIEVSLYPSGTLLDLKLTGMQGDVMKESMTVAKTLAWKLAIKNEPDILEKTIKDMETFKCQGIHIHVPEGATPKDGPSAGTAITSALYSLFTNKKIRSDIAITGEICLQGKVTAIGGLDLKILGGITAGVKLFLFPKENKKDFDEFMEKYSDNEIVDGIEFQMIETIDEVLDIIFV